MVDASAVPSMFRRVVKVNSVAIGRLKERLPPPAQTCPLGGASD
jgi:hypothetical protein